MESTDNLNNYLQSKGKIQNFKSEKTRKKFLNEVGKQFIENQLFEGLSSVLKTLKHPIMSKMKNNIKKLAKLDENVVSIPLTEVRDLINFTIFVEIDNLIGEKNKKPLEISKFTSILESNYKNTTIFDSPQETYSEEEILEALYKTSKLYTNNLEIKNDYYIITFD